MSPPIDIDGSEIQSATIDGEDVTEITIDGQQTAGFVDIPDSGVSRWTFDDADTQSGDALDVWGNNNGTINSATTGVSGANQTYTTNEAYSFDGTNDYVNAGTDSSLNPSSAMSVALWMYPTQKSNTARLMGRWNTGSGTTKSYILGIHSPTNTLEFSWNSSGSFNRVGYDLSNISTGIWTHYVATFDNGSVIQYLDGSQVNSGSGGSTIETGTAPTVIGDLDDVNTSPWAGDIDDPRFYDKALSSTEVSDLYQTGSISG